MNIDSLLTRIISWSFTLLFFLVPLFFTPFNSELFEFNKIVLVYGLTILIVGAWLGRMLLEKKILFKRTPLDIPLILFLVSQLAATLFSIDRHTSLWGYYSRFNGGLLSTLSYLFLYWALVSNGQVKDVLRMIKASLVAGLIVSLYGIGEHFGHSFSCLLFEGRFTVDCWVQDVQARVFATLGQPNWLAAYLAVLLPVATGKLLTAKNKKGFLYYLILNVAYFTCLLFTGSRSGFLGLGLASIVFWLLVFIAQRKQVKGLLKPFFVLNAIYLILIVLFGSPFSQLNQYLPFKPKAPAVTVNAGPQLEVGGTESGKIRQIVWKGAWEIFRHYPIFGTGVESFAYSYYSFRPLEHNLVSEWDFLYNKAHNEYLNYLSTTGIVGLASYLLLIGAFIFQTLRVFKKKGLDSSFLILVSLFTGWLSILISNFFGFAVVLVSLYFFLIPGLVFIFSSSTNSAVEKPLSFKSLSSTRKLVFVFLILATGYLLFTIVNLWRADFFYSLGQKYGKQSQYVLAYQNLNKAINLSPSEPVFLNELSSVTANLALAAASQKEATMAAQLTQAAVWTNEAALQISPANLNLWKTKVRIFYLLSSLDPKYLDEAISALKKAMVLAPTDPKLIYNLGLLLARSGQNEEALKVIEKAIELKPNYEEARRTLALFYEELGNNKKAAEQLKMVLQQKGTDSEIEKKIEKLEKP